ncbi:MAG: GIY-YIG nuclease family protein [Rickettsiales bacterium]|nr:GIY-YIG nuclease family protein [Rickettsiales bacterium]
MMPWVVYILECADGTLYTGITTDLDVRLAKHASGTGAKYTRGRGPLVLRYRESYPTKSSALKREIYVKSLPREQKLLLTKRKRVKKPQRAAIPG